MSKNSVRSIRSSNTSEVVAPSRSSISVSARTLKTVFSRIPDGGGYVQDALRRDAERVRRIVAQGAIVRVCGSRAMARCVAETLDAAWGKYAEVDKHRTLYLYQNVRIHLDEVVNLGRFIEFEAVIQLEDEQQLAHENLKRLMNLFQIEDGDLVELSYGDIMRNEIYRLGR